MSVSNIARPIIQNPVPAVATPVPQTLPSAPVDKNQLAGVVDKVKKTIDMLGDGLKALDISEREALRPMWGVLKEGLELLNGEPDDWDFSSTTTQDQLKQLSLLLNLHAKKFQGYINAEQQKSSVPTSFGKVCTILSKMCEALSTEIKKCAPEDGLPQINTLEDSVSSMSKLEFLTFKTKLSALKDPAIDELIKHMNQTWACSISAEAGNRLAFDFSGDSGQNLNTLEKLTKTHKELTEKIDNLEAHIKTNINQLNLLTSSKEISKEYKRMVAHMKEVKSGLENRLSKIKDYQSPDTKQKICAAKQIEIQATINLIKDQKKPLTYKQNNLINSLQSRANILGQYAKSTNVTAIDSSSLLGRKPIKGIGKLFHFGQAIKQESALNKMANTIISSENLNIGELETPHFTERMLMQSLLEKAGIKDASKQLKASISRELNSSEWGPINSEFSVPVEDKAHQSQAAVTVTTKTMPAGQLFTDPNHIKITSKDSPITASTTAEYKHTDKAGKTVNGGINSHCSTEVNHVTTGATTSSFVDGKESFGGTRHGTLAPYGLDEAGIKAIPDAELGKTIHALFGKAEVGNTTITAGAANQTTTDTTASTSKTSKDPLREEFIKELSNILLTTENGQRNPTAMKERIKQLMTDPALQSALAGLVKANPILGQLLQRQGALNRAREVFILEMTRSPEFLEQIAKREEVLFTSVGLLTPDNLRHQLHKLFGFSASGDEKEMVAIQAQAWEDLRSEIAAKRIEINGQVVKAEILDFNLGVNKGATVMATNSVIGEAVSGWDYANERVNNKSMINLQKITTTRLDTIQTKLNEKNFHRSSNPPTNSEELKKLDSEIKALSRDIAIIKELNDQITAMWEDGSYREAGNEPYKLASRVALLSHLLGGGTVFNCKSGKDRTAQLDAEVKFLAFQIRTSNGKVPKPDRKRTNFEKVQFATFIFFDESRRKMQEFNTGYGGSKLVGQPALYGNFTPTTGNAKTDEENKAATIKQFQGLSKAVPS